MPAKALRIIGIASVAAILAAPALADPVTIEVTAWKGNDAEPAGLPDLIARFESENPDIKVKLNYIARLDTDVVLPPRLQGNNAPDVMMTDMPLVKVWGEAGLLADLDKSSAWFSNVQPSLQSSILLDDKAYIMPLEVIGMGNFVNMGLLKRAGIDAPPTTIDELKSDCRKLDAAGIKPMIFSGSFSAPLFVVANGLERSSVPAASFGSGATAFKGNEAFGSTLDSIRELIDAKCFDPKLQAGVDPWSTGLSEFKAGNFAMMPQGAWNISDFQKVSDLDFEFAPIPSKKATGVALDLFGIGWSVSSKSAHPDEARKFVDFFTKDENLKVMTKAESAYSPFVGGTSGVPDLAAPYNKAREDGGIINYPFALLQWPKPLEKELWDSLTGFLLDPSKPNDDVLSRWDGVVEDNL